MIFCDPSDFCHYKNYKCETTDVDFMQHLLFFMHLLHNIWATWAYVRCGGGGHKPCVFTPECQMQPHSRPSRCIFILCLTGIFWFYRVSTVQCAAKSFAQVYK